MPGDDAQSYDNAANKEFWQSHSGLNCRELTSVDDKALLTEWSNLRACEAIVNVEFWKKYLRLNERERDPKSDDPNLSKSGVLLSQQPRGVNE